MYSRNFQDKRKLCFYKTFSISLTSSCNTLIPQPPGGDALQLEGGALQLGEALQLELRALQLELGGLYNVLFIDPASLNLQGRLKPTNLL